MGHTINSLYYWKYEKYQRNLFESNITKIITYFADILRFIYLTWSGKPVSVTSLQYMGNYFFSKYLKKQNSYDKK